MLRVIRAMARLLGKIPSLQFFVIASSIGVGAASEQRQTESRAHLGRRRRRHPIANVRLGRQRAQRAHRRLAAVVVLIHERRQRLLR